MIDLIFLIAIVIINLVVAQIGFVFFRYFILRRQRCYENEVAKLKGQVENNKLSESLFRQEKQRLRREYKPEFYEKWFGGR